MFPYLEPFLLAGCIVLALLDALLWMVDGLLDGLEEHHDNLLGYPVPVEGRGL